MRLYFSEFFVVVENEVTIFWNCNYVWEQDLLNVTSITASGGVQFSGLA